MYAIPYTIFCPSDERHFFHPLFFLFQFFRTIIYAGQWDCRLLVQRLDTESKTISWQLFYGIFYMPRYYSNDIKSLHVVDAKIGAFIFSNYKWIHTFT